MEMTAVCHFWQTAPRLSEMTDAEQSELGGAVRPLALAALAFLKDINNRKILKELRPAGSAWNRPARPEIVRPFGKSPEPPDGQSAPGHGRLYRYHFRVPTSASEKM